MNPFIESIRVYAESSEHVWINADRLDEVARKFANKDFIVPDWRAPVSPGGDSTEFIDFLGVRSSVNFYFNDQYSGLRFGVEYKGVPWKRAFTIWAALARVREEEYEILNTDFLAEIDLETVERIFRGDLPLFIMGNNIYSFRRRVLHFFRISEVFQTWLGNAVSEHSITGMALLSDWLHGLRIAILEFPSKETMLSFIRSISAQTFSRLCIKDELLRRIVH